VRGTAARSSDRQSRTPSCCIRCATLRQSDQPLWTKQIRA
jgi:hypothetical protein